jgi:hypothetical protein
VEKRILRVGREAEFTDIQFHIFTLTFAASIQPGFLADNITWVDDVDVAPVDFWSVATRTERKFVESLEVKTVTSFEIPSA